MVAISIINVCVLYFHGGFYARRTERLMAHLRLLLYSLRKKNGVWRKCEVSETLLMHTLWSGEPQLAGVCGHFETRARFKWRSYILICWNNILWSIYGIRLALWCFICWPDRPARFAQIPAPPPPRGMTWSEAWSQTIHFPKTPQVFGVKMIILLLQIDLDPPQSRFVNIKHVWYDLMPPVEVRQ